MLMCAVRKPAVPNGTALVNILSYGVFFFHRGLQHFVELAGLPNTGDIFRGRFAQDRVPHCQWQAHPRKVFRRLDLVKLH